MINTHPNIVTNIDTLTGKNRIIYSIIGASCIILILAFSYFVLIPIILLFFYSIVFKNTKKFLIWFVVVTLLTFVGELNATVRLLIQIADLIILLFLFFVRYGLKISAYPKISSAISLFLLLYYFALLISTSMSNYPLAGAFMIFRQTVFFVIVYLLFAMIEDEKEIKILLSALLFSAFIMASSTIYSFLFYSGPFFDLTSGTRGRIAGLITNPNNISNYYLIAFPLLIISVLKNKIFISSKLAWILIFYFSFALIITLSRSALLGILVSSSILLFVLNRKYFYYIISIALITLLIIIFNDSVQNIFSLLFRIERGVTGRDYLWELSFNVIKDNPIFGLGPGAYKYEAFNYFPIMLNSWTGEMLIKTFIEANGANLSHNYFLFLFSELGVLGLAISIYLMIIFLSFWRVLCFFNDKTNNSYYLVVALLAIGTSEFVRSLFESIGILFYGVISADLPFWLVFISIAFLFKKNMKHSQKQPQVIKK